MVQKQHLSLSDKTLQQLYKN